MVCLIFKVDDYVVVLSRNPDSSPTSLAYSRWTTNSQIGVTHRRLGLQQLRGLVLLQFRLISMYASLFLFIRQFFFPGTTHLEWATTAQVHQ